MVGSAEIGPGRLVTDLPLERSAPVAHPATAARGDAPWTRRILIGTALVLVGLLVVVPLAAVFAKGLEKGLALYGAALVEPDALAAMVLTAKVAAVAVVANVIFGIAAAWAIARFRFPGRSLLTTVIDLPLAVSPVIAGMVFVLLFGKQGWFGPWLEARDIKVIFALPGIVLATIFVTVPFVARELIPVMEEQGAEEEEAAIVLGASGWQTFVRVTIPKIRSALFYGTILCAARAVGEFGAVSVVSGHIRGLTNTMPLHIEILYNEYNFTAAFAVASVLTLGALATLTVKALADRRRRAGRTARSEASTP
jgi:sulfate/thiosulfate transport system permease protein